MLEKTLLRLYDYLYYSRRYSQFNTLCYLCDNIPLRNGDISVESKINMSLIFEYNKELQKQLTELNHRFSDLCASCCGACCFKRTEWFFTVIDYWVRKDGLSHINGYAKLPKRYWCSSILTRLKNLFNNSVIINNYEIVKEKCIYLNEGGCKLMPKERPIKCLLYYCKNIRNSMNYEFIKTHSRIVNELYNNSYRVFEILCKESNCSFIYGRLSLFLTV